jgi:hypothetical protein
MLGGGEVAEHMWSMIPNMKMRQKKFAFVLPCINFILVSFVISELSFEMDISEVHLCKGQSKKFWWARKLVNLFVYVWKQPTDRPTDHPNNEKSKGWVLRKRKTSYLPRPHRSCVRNALLEMVNGALWTVAGEMFVLKRFSSWWKALTCMSVLIDTLAFVLQLKKTPGSLSHGSGALLDVKHCAELAVF